MVNFKNISTIVIFRLLHGPTASCRRNIYSLLQKVWVECRRCVMMTDEPRSIEDWTYVCEVSSRINLVVFRPFLIYRKLAPTTRTVCIVCTHVKPANFSHLKKKSMYIPRYLFNLNIKLKIYKLQFTY